MADMKFNCPSCSQSLEVDADAAGHRIECPACAKTLMVPVPTARKAGGEIEGLLGFVEQMLKRMIAGVFRFVFIDSPERIWRFIVRSFPWFIRLLRVMVYAGCWALLVFWPLLLVKCVPHLDHASVNGIRAFVAEYNVHIRIGGYVWATICLAGSVWGIVRWAVSRKSPDADAPDLPDGLTP